MRPTSSIERLSTVAKTGRRDAEIGEDHRGLRRPAAPATGFRRGARRRHGTFTGTPSRDLDLARGHHHVVGPPARRRSRPQPARRSPISPWCRRLAVDDAEDDWSSPCGTSACSGTNIALSRRSQIRSTRANRPGRSGRRCSARAARMTIARPAGVDLRIDRIDLAGEALARQGVDLDRDRLADRDLRRGRSRARGNRP